MTSSRLSTTFEGDNSSIDTGSVYNSSLLEASPSMPPATESSTANSSSSESPGRYPLPNTPLVVRSNFGKGGGFVPTVTPRGNQMSMSPDRGYGGGSGGEEHYDPQQRGVAKIRAEHVPSQRPAVSYPQQISRVPSDVSKPFDEHNNNNMGGGEQRRQKQLEAMRYPTQAMNRVSSGGSKPFDQAFDEQKDESTAAAAVLLHTSRDSSTRLNTSTGDDTNQAVLNAARLSSTRPTGKDSARDSSTRLNTSTGEDSNQAISAPASETQNLKDWERSPPRRQQAPNSSHRSYYSDTNEDDETFGSFRMSPPRISPPRNVPYNPGSSDRDASDDSRDLSAEAHLGGKSPPRAKQLEENYQEFRRNNNRQEQEQGHGTQREQEQEGGDDDSLFDFEEAARRQAKAAEKANKKLRRGRRSSQDEDDDEDADDTSLEKDYGAVTPQTNLQERTQAAWKRKSQAARRATSSELLNSRATQSQSQNVSFGKDDTVHTFEPTLDGTMGTSCRSLNSEYTKSAESEVEDVIKDIFMIGSSDRTKPGRRKVMYSQNAKHRVNDPVDDFEDEETTMDQSEHAEDSPKKYSSATDARVRGRTRREKGLPNSRRRRSMNDIDEEKDVDDDDDEDPLAGVWSYMEGGINAVSNVLGLESVSSESLEITKNTQKERDAKPKRKEQQGGFEGFINYYSDVLLGPAASNDETPAESEVKVNKMRVEEPDDLETPPSLEEDLRLVDLAIQAARSAHRLQGYEFDETYDVNIVTDIKFSVVDLSLPLGLIFQENDGGCWVTKVLPQGSAMKSRNVKVGDQLAAIDGASAIRLTVDEIAKIIKGKKSVIELTFLRFVGPLRPAAGDIQEEGYEVKAATKKDPPEGSDPVKEGSRRPKKTKETGTKLNSPRTQQSLTKSPTDNTRTKSNSPRAQQSATKSPTDKTSARVVKGKEADSGKRRFRWFGRKKQMEKE